MSISEFAPVKFQDGRLLFLDQRVLPNEERYVEMGSVEDVYDAIKSLLVRGAPAIGVGAAYGMWLAAKLYCEKRGFIRGGDSILSDEEVAALCKYMESTGAYLISARPTAVNLEWAVKRVLRRLMRIAQREAGEAINTYAAVDILCKLQDEAYRIQREDEESCFRMGEYGLSLLQRGMGLLTHCNAGVLATAGYGTALAPIHLGQERGYGFKVFADETRPLLQGARLTSWELAKSGVDVTLICDNMASLVMKKGLVGAVLVGCDRMAANGDGANKIGTSGVAVLAKEYGIPFYMFVPTSTIDMTCRTGDDIVIEERNGDEIREMWYERPMAPAGVKTFNPAFDVTEHSLITAIVTERGIIKPPYDAGIRAMMGGIGVQGKDR